ncbi:MAG TPA: hypothetical protein VN540_04765 [Clostridia bacterium]|nr:hypothetical protein [Clostridia bacterium]
MTDHGVVTMGDGKQYRLLEVKSSGTLSFNADQVAKGLSLDIWACQGGYSGSNGSVDGSRRYGGSGGRGGNWFRMGMSPKLNTLIVVIGAGGNGTTSLRFDYGAFLRAQWAFYEFDMGGNLGGNNGNAGSFNYNYDTSSWQYYASTPGGNGVYPFDDSTYFNRHCSGGGGGGVTSSGTGSGSLGGDYGAGRGARTQGQNASASNAIFYGAGGGGGDDGSNYPPGSGYQGVMYLRITA